MSVRLATEADAERFESMQADFYRSIDREFRPLTADKLRARHKARNIIAVASDDAVCEIKVDAENREAKVEVLLPRGIDAAFWVPVLSKALVETWTRFPHPDWYIWAQPMDAVDEHGKPDGGASETLRWQEMYPSAERFEAKGSWWAGATFGDVMLPLVGRS